MGLRERRVVEIIEAAMKVFGKQGFHKGKVEEIAKIAGIGKGTVYEYFHSKKDLFEQMIEHIGMTYFDMISKELNAVETVHGKLIAFAKHHGNFISSHMDMAEHIIPGTNFLSDEVKCEMVKIQTSIFLLMDHILENGIKTGEIRSDINRNAAVLCIVGAVNQSYASQVCFGKASPKDIDPTPIIDVIFNGLVNK